MVQSGFGQNRTVPGSRITMGSRNTIARSFSKRFGRQAGRNPTAESTSLHFNRGEECRMSKVLGVAILLATLAGASRMAGAQAPGCDGTAAVETEGQRRLALIVGVGKYKTSKLNSLPGATKDAQRFYELLTSGYGFPAQNVCMLLDEQATVAAFKAKFDQVLVQRARQNDEVVIYFAGHGSQQPDQKGDERDDYDETLVF